MDAGCAADAARSRADGAGTALFVAAGGGGDVLAATLLRRLLSRDDVPPFVVTYSWDRLMIDPLPGPRDPSCFEDLERFGAHNYVVTARSRVRAPGNSLLPRLARELGTSFYLLDPTGGASGMRAQLRELVSRLDVTQVWLVDSGGDILSTGREPELRSPMSDALTLAAADDVGARVDVLVAGTGLDGELPGEHVRATIEQLMGQLDYACLGRREVKWCLPLLEWHPSEVNGLLVMAAMGFEGTVEIRDAAYRVRVDGAGAAVHRCTHGAAIAHNALAKAMLASTDLAEAEGAMLDHQHHSEIDYQRNRAARYRCRSTSPQQRHAGLQRLLRYGVEHRDQVDALSLRRAAEIMGMSRDDLEAFGPALERRCRPHYHPPLWLLRPPKDLAIFVP